MEIIITCEKCPLRKMTVCTLSGKRIKKTDRQCKQGIEARVDKGIEVLSELYNKAKGEYTRQIFQGIYILDRLDVAYREAKHIKINPNLEFDFGGVNETDL